MSDSDIYQTLSPADEQDMEKRALRNAYLLAGACALPTVYCVGMLLVSLFSGSAADKAAVMPVASSEPVQVALEITPP